MGAHRNAIVLTAGTFGLIVLLDLYLVYYLKVFSDKFGLPSEYFSVVQALFLVWNAINDPILGFMQDIGCCGIEWIRDRRKVMRYAGPVFAFSFLLFWFPWAKNDAVVTAIQLLFSLFLFDLLFTLVLSAYCGMCVEKAPTHGDRVRITVYGELFGLLAGFLILPIESITQNFERFNVFQIYCVGVSIFAATSMYLCGTFVSADPPEIEAARKMKEKEEEKSTIGEFFKISWQVIREPRFIGLIGGQFFKIIRFMINEQFLLVFVESLLVNNGFLERGSVVLGAYYVIVRSLGSILFFALWFPVAKLGCHNVIHGLNVVGILNCALMYLAGRQNLMWICIFLVIENAFARCGQHGYYIIISGEVIDSDQQRYERAAPLSTIIFTMKALFTKPADQLAPIVMIAILKMHNYDVVKTGCMPTLYPNAKDTTNPSELKCDSMFFGVFLGMVLLPVICIIGESLFLALDQWAKRKQVVVKRKISDIHLDIRM